MWPLKIKDPTTKGATDSAQQENGWSTQVPRKSTKAKLTVDGSSSSGLGCTNKYKGLDMVVEEVVHLDTVDSFI